MSIKFTTACSFTEILDETENIGNSVLSRPVSEIVYSRSDYDGYKWWTTWFDCRKELLSQELIHEIDTFHIELFSMPEFTSLDTMKQFCHNAKPTGDSSEFDLFSETEHFHIWVRLITRFRDYNLYVHYYLKQ